MFQEILRLIAELRLQPPPAPAHEAFDCHAFKRNRQKECVQMPVKIARSTPRPSFGLPEAAGSQPHLASGSRDAAKSLLSTLISESSGECRFKSAMAPHFCRCVEFVERFLHEQGKERTEHVAANGGIAGVQDRATPGMPGAPRILLFGFWGAPPFAIIHAVSRSSRQRRRIQDESA